MCRPHSLGIFFSPNIDHVKILKRAFPFKAGKFVHSHTLLNGLLRGVSLVQSIKISEVSPHDLYWENKMFKRIRSIDVVNEKSSQLMKQIRQLVQGSLSVTRNHKPSILLSHQPEVDITLKNTRT